MKQKFLKTMLLLCALVVGNSNVGATTVTKTVNQLVSANSWTVSSGSDIGTLATSFSLDSNITISTSGDANCGSIWGTTTYDWRLYQNKNGDVTVTASNGNVITSITFTYSVNNTGTLKDGSTTVASGSAQSFAVNTNTTTKTYTVGNTASATNGQVRITQFSVTYVDPSDTRAETTVTITGNETSRYMNQEVATPTAIVKDGETTVGGATVVWSSTNTSVATIGASTGVITLVAPGTTTIKANYAGNASYKPSEASYTLNVYGYYASISAMQTATASAPYNTTTGSAAKIRLYNALVTYVNGNYAYIIDEDGYGALIYENGHGFTAGKIISGNNLEVTLCLFGGATEVKGVRSTGVSTSDGSVTAQTKTIDAVSAANQSMMVKFENVIYNAASSSFTDNTNTIPFVDKFSVNPTLSNGGKYDVTGLLIMDNGTLKVAPIAAEGIESKVKNPTSQWKNGEAALTSITINKAAGTTSFTFETNSDAAVTYSSTNTAVATIAADGTITPVGYGTTTIKANTAATSNYNADEKSFTLKVGDASVDVIEIGNVTFANNSSYQNWTNVSGLTTSATYTGQSMTGQTYIQIRSQSPAGIVSTASAGRVKKISVKWAGTNTNNRFLTIYGKNVAYSSSSELYGDNKGEELGKITYTTNATNGELTIDNDKNYGYIGIKASGAMYIGVLAIEWEENIVPISIGAAEWISYVAPKNVYFPTGTSGYIATAINTNTINLTEVLAVEAGTPVLINGDEGTYGLEVVDAGDCSNVSSNILAASDGSVTGNGSTIYALGVGKTGDNKDKVGFYVVNSGQTVPAGKAYLAVPSPVKEFLTFDFNNDADGIKTLSDSPLKGENIYNLAGQRLSKMQKGINIVNGKKVLY